MRKLPKGISLTPKGRYHARICRNNAVIHVGVYDTVKEAVAARVAFLSRPQSSIAAEPATAEAPPTAVVPETATTKPQTAQERVYQTDRPDLCPACRSPLWAPCSGGGMVCNQCGLQKLPFIPGPGISRTEWDARSWRVRQ
jgi:hypothetical protein